MMDNVEYASACWKSIGIEGDGSCAELPVRGHCRNCPEYASAGRKLFDRSIPKDHLQQWTQVIASEKETQASDLLSVIVFRVNDEWLALRTKCFQEITVKRTVRCVPHRSNRVFRGLVNIGGELLLCMSIAEILGLSSETVEGIQNQENHRMVVISRPGERFVFEVDEVLGVHRFAPKELQKTPATIAKSPLVIISGIFDLEENKIGLLDEQLLMQAFSAALI